MVTTALSLPLKRRPRALHGAGSGGLPTTAAAAGPRKQQHSQPLSRQRGTSSSQLSFPHLPPVLSVPPRDGFASHSLSQLLINGSLSVRGGIIGAGSGEPPTTEVSTGRLGGGGSSNRTIQPRTASQRDSHKLRQLRLAGSRGCNNSGAAVGEEEQQQRQQQRDGLARRNGTDSDRSDEESGAVMYTRPCLHSSGRGDSQLHEVMELGPHGPIAGTHLAKAYTAPVVALEGAAAEAAAAAGPLSAMATAAEMAVAATQSSAVTDGYVWEGSSYEHNEASVVIIMGSPETGRNADGGSSGGSSGGSGGAVVVAPADAADSGSVMDPVRTTSTDVPLALGATGTAASVDGNVMGSAAAAVAAAEGGESNSMSATFTGRWMAHAPSSAARSTRAAMSMPLPRLGIQRAVGGTGDGEDDENLDHLLSVRGSDIKSARAVESDPEPELEPDPQGDLEPSLNLDLAAAPRLRESRLHHPRALHGRCLVPVSLTSEQGNLAQMVKGGLNTRACPGSFAGATAKSVAGSNITSGSGALTVSVGFMPYRRTSMPNNLAALMRGVLHGLSGHGGNSGPESPCSVGAGLIRSLPLAAYYRHLFRSCQPGAPGSVLVARGLSVRMG
ncbi:hypothetical protein Vretifemale_15160 [Volvox reticuliferus]|uniref:Uncharacterized protein n=1 Tax=Volvox reticuliferus TaxID=1737510 RepID=A0A8J4FUW3_9CHLO|nr:hypothetical protein Vretifemale_15160 [Volvox reticuliferus]